MEALLQAVDSGNERALLTLENGRWTLVERDLPADLLARIEAAQGVRERCISALRMRENLINLKKVLLKFFVPLKEVERKMSMLTSLFYRDGDCWYEHVNSSDVTLRLNAERYRDFNTSFQQCKGAAAALQDCRSLVKRLCCVPRHVNTPSKAALKDFPKTSVCFHFVKDLGLEAPAFYKLSPDEELILSPVDMLANSALEEILDEALLDDPDERRVVRGVLIGRGVAKALRIRLDTRRASAAIEIFCQEIERGQSNIGSEEVSNNGDLLKKVIRYRSLLQFVPSILRDLKFWLDCIEKEPDQRWFLAGDGVGMSFPKEFKLLPHILADFQNTYREREPILRERLKMKTDPKYGIFLKGKKQCLKCGNQYSKPFMAPCKLCYFCEEDARHEAFLNAKEQHHDKEGFIPCTLRLRCSGQPKVIRTMCPHSLRCFICDFWSCDDCNVIRGDGESVLSFVEELGPNKLLFDFDRTLASTKSGANPLQSNKHKIPPHLHDALGLLAKTHNDVHVVTRNSHKYEIEVFLESKGLGHVQVHCCRASKLEKRLTKAEIIGHLVGKSDVAIFVDDSPAEILHPKLHSLIKEMELSLKLVLFEG